MKPQDRRQALRESLPRLYVIVDADQVGARDYLTTLAEVVESGVGSVQIRAKNMGGRTLYQLLAKWFSRKERTPLTWVNDRADLARCFPVDGIHVGQQDLPPEAVRQVVGSCCWIGQSTHSEDQVIKADTDANVDLIAVGPVYGTATKHNAGPEVGLRLVERARALTAKPLVAIGGIDANRAPAVLAAGADCVAVSAAALREPVSRSCRSLLKATEDKQ